MNSIIRSRKSTLLANSFQASCVGGNTQDFKTPGFQDVFRRRLRFHQYVFRAKRISIYTFMPIVYTKTSKTYTENAYFQKRLPKWIQTKTPYFFSCINDQNVLFFPQSHECHLIYERLLFVIDDRKWRNVWQQYWQS